MWTPSCNWILSTWIPEEQLEFLTYGYRVVLQLDFDCTCAFSQITTISENQMIRFHITKACTRIFSVWYWARASNRLFISRSCLKNRGSRRADLAFAFGPNKKKWVSYWPVYPVEFQMGETQKGPLPRWCWWWWRWWTRWSLARP